MNNKAEANRIREVVEGWAEGLRNKDVQRVMSHSERKFVHYSLAPPLVANEGPKGLQAWFDTWQGPIGYEFRDLEITADDNVAFCTCLNRMSGTQNGGKTELWFRHTIGLRKIDDRWKIVHLHESVPFLMDGSDKAAVDLRP
jgi:PhnB protein